MPCQLCSALALCFPSPLWGLTQHPADKGTSGPEGLEILQCLAMYLPRVLGHLV